MTTTPDTKKLAEDIATVIYNNPNYPGSDIFAKCAVLGLLTLMGEMREALEFYADEGNAAHCDGNSAVCCEDGHKLADAALARIEPLKHLMEVE